MALLFSSEVWQLYVHLVQQKIPKLAVCCPHEEDSVGQRNPAAAPPPGTPACVKPA